MEIDKDLINKYNIAVPRYTSYPTANHFRDGIQQDEYIQSIKDSNKENPKNIAFYIHIPFCNKICYYCGCNTQIARDENYTKAYIDALKKEIKQIIPLIDQNRKISQIHFGGGTPNSINVSYIKEIVELLTSKHQLTKYPEIAIECNPASLDQQYIDELLNIGFNRISIGIQDFNTEVLNSVNREIPDIPLEKLLSYIRKKSPNISVNFDFIYGLPGQTLNSFIENIKTAIELKPERLVTFSYAHVPWLKKHQQILEKKGLPSPAEKMDMFLSSKEILTNNGYQAIGLDHYVLANDELAISVKNQQLHRNFQGYCTLETTGQVYAFGVSAISQLKYSYLQNIKTIDQYIDLINQNLFPVDKGCFLSKEDFLIKETINQIMCNAYLDIHHIAQKNNITIQEFKDITHFKEGSLKPFIEDNLIEFKDNILTINDQGKLFIRNIASQFDPSYISKNNTYSKSV